MLSIDNKKTSDVHYRYKMPKIEIKIEGRGNGIKTVLTNIDSVANAVKRDVDIIMKFYGMRTGSSVQSKVGKHIIMGNFTRDKMQEVIFEFINSFVLCKQCQNPETDFVEINKGLGLKCRACSSISTINFDIKFVSFIQKKYAQTLQKTAKETFMPSTFAEDDAMHNEEYNEKEHIDSIQRDMCDLKLTQNKLDFLKYKFRLKNLEINRLIFLTVIQKMSIHEIIEADATWIPLLKYFPLKEANVLQELEKISNGYENIVPFVISNLYKNDMLSDGTVKLWYKNLSDESVIKHQPIMKQFMELFDEETNDED